MDHPIVIWEITRECDLNCRNCPSPPVRSSNQLSTYESYKTIDQIAALDPRELVMTGGDPLQREDVYELVDYARRRGLDPALVVSPTMQLTFEAVERLQRHGLTRLVFAIDGPNAAMHDTTHGVSGAFQTTVRAMRWARSFDLATEVNTLVTKRNIEHLERIADVVAQLGAKRWNVHFSVPVRESMRTEMLTPAEADVAFETLTAVAADAPFDVRTIEAPHYRRFLLERELESRLRGDDVLHENVLRRAVSYVDGIIFISHAGDVRATELMPLTAGNIRYRPLAAIYRDGDFFNALRDLGNLTGRCGGCEYKLLCGGSRARAWATSGQLFGSDPLCGYEGHSAAIGGAQYRALAERMSS